MPKKVMKRPASPVISRMAPPGVMSPGNMPPGTPPPPMTGQTPPKPQTVIKKKKK